MYEQVYLFNTHFKTTVASKIPMKRPGYNDIRVVTTMDCL